jgi:hypothetical protein
VPWSCRSASRFFPIYPVAAERVSALAADFPLVPAL